MTVDLRSVARRELSEHVTHEAEEQAKARAKLAEIRARHHAMLLAYHDHSAPAPPPLPYPPLHNDTLHEGDKNSR